MCGNRSDSYLYVCARIEKVRAAHKPKFKDTSLAVWMSLSVTVLLDGKKTTLDEEKNIKRCRRIRTDSTNTQ